MLCNYSVVQLKRLVVFVLGVRHESVQVGLDEAGQTVNFTLRSVVQLQHCATKKACCFRFGCAARKCLDWIG